MDTVDEYTIAPQHSADLSEVDPHVHERVAYSPLKCTYLSQSYDESLLVVCDSCDWTCEVGELPEDTDGGGGYIQPDMCPACAKRGDIGHLRCQSPADGTLPMGWEVPN